jgi:hypothetical protein
MTPLITLRCGHPADRWGCCSVDLSGHIERDEVCGFCYGIDDDKLGPHHRFRDHPSVTLEPPLGALAER